MEAKTPLDIISQTRDSTATPPPPDEVPAHCLPSESVSWSTNDKLFATVFCHWDTATLRELEDVIAPFEAHIKHSDGGFLKWCARHQNAMQCGAAKVPGWARFPTASPDDSKKSDYEVWVSRYTHLVLRRHEQALERLRRVPQRRRRSMTRFFGDRLAMPRETLQSRRRGKAVRALGDSWWKPLSRLLEDQAGHWGVDAEQLKRDFWKSGKYRKVKSGERVTGC